MINSPEVTAFDFASAARARGPCDTRAKHSAALAPITRNPLTRSPPMDFCSTRFRTGLS